MALIAGLVVERLPVRFVAVASYIAILLMLDGSTTVFGLSVGAGMIVQSYIFAAYYGRMGAIRGVSLPIMLVSAGVGAPLVLSAGPVGRLHLLHDPGSTWRRPCSWPITPPSRTGARASARPSDRGPTQGYSKEPQ